MQEKFNFYGFAQNYEFRNSRVQVLVLVESAMRNFISDLPEDTFILMCEFLGMDTVFLMRNCKMIAVRVIFWRVPHLVPKYYDIAGIRQNTSLLNAARRRPKF